MTGNASIYGNLDDILLFCATVEEGSLTKASRRLDIPVSTLSRRLGSLEEKVSEKLLMTKGRELVPTEQGLVFFEAMAPLMGSAIRQFDHFKKEHSTLSGTVNLVVPRAFFYDVVIKIIPELHEDFPGISLNIRVSQQDPGTRPDPDVDLMVSYQSGDTENFSARPLYGRYSGFFVSESFLALPAAEELRRENPDLSALSRLPWIVHFAGETTLPVYRNGSLVSVFNVRPWLAVNDVHALTDFVRAGLGAGVIPIPRARRHRSLVQIFPSFHGLPRRFFLLVRKSPYKIRLVEEVAGRIEASATQWAMKHDCLDFAAANRA